MGMNADSGASDSGSSGDTVAFRIVASSGGPLQAVAGDALALSVVQVLMDGSTQPLPVQATVAWVDPPTVTALSPYGTRQIPLWVFGSQPKAYFVDNPGRPDRNTDLAGVLFILDPGETAGASLNVTANVGGVSPGGQVAATIAIGATPAGDASRGATTYGTNCSICHGATAAGTPRDPDGGFLIDGHPYGYPAPGLNRAHGNLAGNLTWNAALLAMAARADMDNEGLTLRSPMPDWLNPPPAIGNALSTQDFADIYAFLRTQ
jgi:mono/diheme cytochrome c family protein